jgi:hypothetical protein
MIGGLIGRPVECSTGPGRPTPTPTRSSGVRPVSAISARPWVTTQSRTTSGPSEIGRSALVSARILDARSVTASRAWEHDAGGGVEGEGRGGSAAGGGGLAGRGDQAGGHQGVDTLGDGGPGLTGEGGEVGAGARAAVAEQLEHRAGTGLPGGEPDEILHGPQ